MHLQLKKYLIVSFCLLAGIWFCQPVRAYILSGRHTLELMIKALGKAETLIVSQKLKLYDIQIEKIELNETLRYSFPDSFRSDILSEETEKIQVVSSKQALTIIDGKLVHESESGFDPYKDILLYRNRIMLEERLTSLGVDILVSSLGRFQDKIAYVIGAKYPDESVPQIWIDRNTFRPVRWIINFNSDQNNKNPVEIRYMKWQQVGKNWYPMRIEFYEGENMVRMINVESIKINPALSKSLFDIASLKSIYPPLKLDTSEEEKSDDINEVQKAIEDFKKIFE